MVRNLLAMLCVVSSCASAAAQVPQDSKASEYSPFSVVLIQKSLPELSPKQIAGLLSKAWPANLAKGVVIDKADMATALKLTGSGASQNDASFLIRAENGLLILITLSPRPFVDPAESESISDLRNRTMVRQHRATVSISPVRKDEPKDSAENGEVAGLVMKLAAELVNENTLGVMLPYQEIMLAGNKELTGPMREPEPIKALRAASSALVLKSSDDDPRMKAAIQEARTTWPQFEKAYRLKAKNTDSFNVKFPFIANGETEFMWVEVTSIQDGVVTGKLGNAPVQNSKLKLGDVVTKNIRELADWMYLRDGELVGGFTVKVLVDQEAEKSPPSKGSEKPQGQ